MGCGGKTPTYTAPPAPKLPTADELYQSALNYGTTNFPNAMTSRETALGYLSTPESTMDYYSSFQPTSFEQALGNQYFQNVWPDTEAQIRHNLSLSGQANRAYSPSLAAITGREYGNLSSTIGQYLSDLGNTRASSSLQSMLNIDPNAYVNPFVQTGMTQSTNQAQLDWEAAQAAAMAQYQNELAAAKQRSGMFSSVGSGIGSVAALAAAPFTGGASLAYLPMAASLGGSLGNQIGGGYSSTPIDIGTALSLSQLPGQMSLNQTYQDYLKKMMSTATSVNPMGGG